MNSLAYKRVKLWRMRDAWKRGSRPELFRASFQWSAVEDRHSASRQGSSMYSSELRICRGFVLSRMLWKLNKQNAMNVILFVLSK